MKFSRVTNFLTCLIVLLVSLSINAQGLQYDEIVDGDLSDDFENPSGPFTLEIGNNSIKASQKGNPRDIDYITITLPPDLQLDQLFLETYEAEGTNNNAFLGIQEGAAFTTDASSTGAADLLGGITYGSGNLDTDMLPQMGQLGQGFTPPLPTGTYTLWLNQTGPVSEATLRFVVSGTLGLENNPRDHSVSVYPNPTYNSVSIASPSLHIIQIELYTIAGKQIVVDPTSKTISLNAYPSGIYLIRITTDRGVITRKIIKQ